MTRESTSGVVAAFERLRAQGSAFPSSEDPEIVHTLRVSIRRLRVALRLFESALSDTQRKKLARDLKWLFVGLGQLRDLQVFQTACRERLVKGTPGASPLDRRLQQLITGQRRTLLRMVASERYRGLLTLLASVVVSPELELPKRHWFQQHLRRRRRHALAALHAAIDAPARIHVARKELKKLRYTCELSAGHFDEKELGRYLKTMKQVQEELGQIVDLGVWQRLVRKECRARGLRDQLEAQFERERQLCLSCFELHARRFAKTKPFWPTR
jgi:triphosphatase